MPAMQQMSNPLAPKALLSCGLAAIASYPGALLLAACSQALGAMAGGCQWIGLSLSPHRPVWALVNQPTLDFASRSSALGYWLGSLVGPLAVVLATVALLPRPRWLSAEIAIVQFGWILAVISGAWLPLLEPPNGHLGIYLKLSRAPGELLWLAPILTSVVAAIPTLRLLALLRAGHPRASRLTRMITVVLYFGLPLVGWFFVVTSFRATLPTHAMAATLCPLLVGIIIAWYGHPSGLVHNLRNVGWMGVASAVASVGLFWGIVGWAGEPIDEKRAMGVVWATPSSFNNIRDWVEAVSLRDRLETLRKGPARGEEREQ